MHSIKDTVKQLIGKSLDAYNKKYTSPINNRIDNIVAQAGTDNTEIVDARIDSAGVSHTTLNNRILAETKMTDEKLIEYSGSSLSVDDTMPGYLQNIEIKGNTIQNEDNLEDIRSVGDKIEGQELYEIPVLSCGKNLFNPLNKNIECSIGGSQNKVTYKVEGDKIILKSNPSVNSDWGWVEFKNIKVTPNKSYTIHPNATVIKGNVCVFVFDSNNTKLFEIPNISKTFIPTTKHISIRLYVQTTTLYTDAEIHYKPQLEEGSVATPYEPYVEDKLTILSPVQLEKVGDVADRIICKDGVWGVEKNVKTVRLGSESAWYMRTNKNGITIFNTKDYLSNNIPNRVILCDTLTVSNGADQDAIDGYNQILAHKNSNYSQNLYISKDFKNIQLFTAWLDENPVNIKCVTETQPQFIPLPHDQQIKLRTFANKTNISFGCEIEGTIKAQVPKSLGATVNTHTEQINNLNKELDRVKKLEESTVSTVITESDFTTVEATSNGYFEDVKLEGKTLVNLVEGGGVEKNIGVSGGTLSKYNYFTPLKNNTLYTVILNIDAPNEDLTKLNVSLNGGKFGHVNKFINGINCITLTTNENLHNEFWVYFTVGSTIVGTPKLSNVVILEGDHTQNPPSGYIEGLKSVGQSATASEDRVDEIVVSSVNENLIPTPTYRLDIPVGTSTNSYSNTIICKNIPIKPNTTYRVSYGEYINKGSINGYPLRCMTFRDKYDGENVHVNAYTHKNRIKEYAQQVFTTEADAKYLVITTGSFVSVGNIEITELCLTESSVEKPYTSHQSDKKRLLYYNDETQTWEKPILRRWDSIEKHADGKYYYHQRSGEVILNGSENWGMSGSNFGEFACFYLSFNLKINGKSVLSDKFASLEPMQTEANSVIGEGISTHHTTPSFRVIVNKSKLPTQDVQGFKQWLQANNVTVVYQLAQEKVYECTNIDLITYNGETNYIIESGAIVPRTTLKVHNNISNVVSLLQKKVSLLESNMTKYMITQNRMQLASTYSADSVTFKVDYALCSEEVEYNEDLYNLILNNILVGKDNYDYSKMFNIILDYASWNQISWEQFDILVGVMNIQHNPPVEDEVIEEIPNEIM